MSENPSNYPATSRSTNDKPPENSKDTQSDFSRRRKKRAIETKEHEDNLDKLDLVTYGGSHTALQMTRSSRDMVSTGFKRAYEEPLFFFF